MVLSKVQLSRANGVLVGTAAGDGKVSHTTYTLFFALIRT